MDKRIEDFFRQARDIGLSKEEASACHKRIIEKMQGNPVRASEEACQTEQMKTSDPAFTAARDIRLTAEESARAESALRAFMAEHPVNMAAAIRNNERTSRWEAFTSFFSVRYAPAMAAVLVLVLGGGSLSYAAEHALPGDALYPVKVYVNEEVRAAVAVTPEAKATWNTERAERRIAEAETLAAANRLTTDVSETLAANFETHLKTANAQIQVIANNGRENDAVLFTVAVETKLRNHTVRLQNIANAGQAHERATEAIATVLHRVENATNNAVAFNVALNNRIAIAQNVDGSAANSMTMMAVSEDAAASADATTAIAIADQAIATIRMKEGGMGGGTPPQPATFGVPDAIVKMHLLRDMRKRSSSSVSSGSGASSVKRSSRSSMQTRSSTSVNVQSSSKADTASSAQQDTQMSLPSAQDIIDGLFD